MDRKTELMQICENLDEPVKAAVLPMLDDVIFLESRLTELREYPFIAVNPNNRTQQRPTPAAKQYKELLQQYNNCIKILLSAIGKSEAVEDSPLRTYLKQLNDRKE